jgi:predicted Rossmann fold nucleotide-binding protein DprA/Smf involved in DNA uptake
VPGGNKWRRRDSGPVVRPYAVTGGRTAPADGEMLDLLAVVVATGLLAGAGPGRGGDESSKLTPEHRRILKLCENPATVADIAAETALPVGVVRVLLADLTAQGAVTVVRERPAGQRTGNDVLQEILNGLRAL